MSSNKKKNKKSGASAGTAPTPSSQELSDIRDAAFDFVMDLDLGEAVSEQSVSDAASEIKSPKAAEPEAKKPSAPRPKREIRRAPDTLPTVHDQDFVYGKRERTPVSNSSLFISRFGYKHEFCNNGVVCDHYYDAETDKSVGISPRISLDTVWTKAKKWVEAGKGAMPAITEMEWHTARNKLARYITRDDSSKELIVRNVMVIPELTFRELYISRADAVITLINYAVLYDISETEKLHRTWSKIKKYKHKVSLHEASGGIFSSEEVAILKSLNVNYLNDIRKQNVYVLKHHLQGRDFSNIIKEINDAFHEDLERRRDKRYKVYPFVIGYAALAFMTVIGYIYKYDFIKDAADKALYANVGSVVWILGLLVMLRGVIRARRRRRTKRPDYRYFTAKVKRATTVLTLFSIFSIGSLLLFFQRYDGYNDTVYYRDLKDGTVAIAGLRDEEATYVSVPSSMDEKTVTEIDLFAFRKDEFSHISIPDTVTKIDKNAFLKCVNLASVIQEKGVTEIGKKAFSGCSALYEVGVIDTAVSIGKGAFAGCSSIKELYFGALTDIGKSAFEGCESLDTISFGTVIEAIPDGAFRGCSSIVTAAAFENVKVVGNNAFRDCSSLQDVNFANVTQIGKGAFSGCSSFENIVITSTTESIGKGAFDGCTSLNSITVPFIGPDRENEKNKSLSYILDCNESSRDHDIEVILSDLTAIHGKAFNKCKGISKIVLPDTVTDIEKGAFKSAASLRSVNLPAGITVLHEAIFEDCSNLVEITGGESVEIIEASAFTGCAQLVSVSFPKLKSIGETAFENCYMLTGIGAHDALESVDNNAFINCTALESIDLSMCDWIGTGLFKSCSYLKTAYLPTEMTYIPGETFKGCTSLSSFTTGTNVTEIHENAFADSGLSEVVIPEGVKVICKEAFRNTSLSSITLPDSIERIDKGAFEDCPSLTSVSAPFIGKTASDTKNGFKHMFGGPSSLSSITLRSGTTLTKTALKAAKSSLVSLTLAEGYEKIEAKALADFPSLETVVLPESLKEIGKSAFDECYELTSINLGDTKLEKCGEGAFNACGSISSVVIPSTLKEIPKRMFEGCFGLSSITISDGVEKIGEQAFSSTNISGLIIPDSVTKADKEFAIYCTSLVSITFSENMKEIPEGAFKTCYALESVIIPENIKTIGKRAFDSCTSLETLVIEEGVETIGKNAFEHCSSLKKITLPDSIKTLEKDTFKDCYNVTTLVTPFVGKTTSTPKKISYICDSYSLSVLEITSAEFVGKKTFRGSYMLTNVTFGEGVKTIEPGISEGILTLNRVDLPESLKDYADYFPEYAVYIDGVDYATYKSIHSSNKNNNSNEAAE